MWVAVELSDNHSEWKKIASSPILAELKSLERRGENVYFFWDGQFPSDPTEFENLHKEIANANGGADVRVFVGAVISHIEGATPSTLCSGSCFCISAHGGRRCEVCYKGSGGSQCVPCGSAC